MKKKKNTTYIDRKHGTIFMKKILYFTNGGFCMETRLVYHLIKMVVDKEAFLLDFIKLFSTVLIYRYV